MSPRFALLLLLVVPACATSRQHDKLSFEEAFGKDSVSAAVPAQVPVVLARPTKRRGQTPQVVSSSVELQSALIAFAARSRQARAGARNGSSLPLTQAANWESVSSALARFLQRAPEETSSFDLIRARVTLEAELDQDARTYGDFPSDLANRVLDDVTKLAVRMAHVRRLKVQPSEENAPRFQWPVQPVMVTSIFGRRMHPITRTYKTHFGLDLVASEGQLVSSAGSGTVIRADWNGSHGLHIEVRHAGNVSTRYSHLSQLLVEVGTTVRPGDPLGLAGNTGSSTGPHLHFEFWRDGKPKDPLEEMGDPEQSRRPAVAVR